MAYVNSTRLAPAHSSFFGDIAARFSAHMARRKIFKETLAELRQMSDRDLNDLGLSRHSIVDVAREAAYGK